MKNLPQLVIGQSLIASLIKRSLAVEQRTKYYKVQKSIAMISALINFRWKVGSGAMEKWELQDIVPILQLITQLNSLVKVKNPIVQILDQLLKKINKLF